MLKQIVLPLVVLISMISCKKDENKEVKPAEVVEILVKTAPSKTDYFEDEELDLSGLEVELIFSNEESKEVSFENFIEKGLVCHPENGAKLTTSAGVVKITHSPTGLSANQSVSVNNIELVDIELKTPPTKNLYYVGEKLDLTGLQITLSFNNGLEYDIDHTELSEKGVICNQLNGMTLIPETQTKVYFTHSSSGKHTFFEFSFHNVTDVDNNNYKLVKIGEQVWMSENLRTTKYNDGTQIQLIKSETVWSQLTTGAFCYYLNDENNIESHGLYYNWFVISDMENVCPVGWHVPSHEEWTILGDYLMENGYNYDGTTEGNKYAKALTTGDWKYSEVEGAVGDPNYQSNSTGFSATGGWRWNSGEFYPDKVEGFWWSSSLYDNEHPLGIKIRYDSEELLLQALMNAGGAIRCVKD